jgi:hypothetical protein
MGSALEYVFHSQIWINFLHRARLRKCWIEISFDDVDLRKK